MYHLKVTSLVVFFLKKYPSTKIESIWNGRSIYYQFSGNTKRKKTIVNNLPEPEHHLTVQPSKVHPVKKLMQQTFDTNQK